MFPSERKNFDGTGRRATADVFRRALAEAVDRHLPTWSQELTPHALQHFCASQLYVSGMNLFAVQELLGHAWTATTARYIHVHATHVEDAWVTGQRRSPTDGKDSPSEVEPAAGRANRGNWKASELHRKLADRGMVISTGKMSGLWSGTPNVVRLDELDIICAVLGCGVEELLIPEPDTVAAPPPAAEDAPP